LRGRVPIHAGSGPGLSPRRLGAKFGAEKETLTVHELPSHTHEFTAALTSGTDNNPQGKFTAESPSIDLYAETDASVNMAASAITHVGGSRSHTNLMPFLCINFIVALFGIYPSRH